MAGETRWVSHADERSPLAAAKASALGAQPTDATLALRLLTVAGGAGLAASASQRHGETAFPEGHSSERIYMTQAHSQMLQEADPRSVFVVRNIGRLGFQAVEHLILHFSLQGAVRRVLSALSNVVSKDGVLLQVQPGDVGFVIMHSADSARAVLEAGSDHRIAGVVVSVQPFSASLKPSSGSSNSVASMNSMLSTDTGGSSSFPQELAAGDNTKEPSPLLAPATPPRVPLRSLGALVSSVSQPSRRRSVHFEADQVSPAETSTCLFSPPQLPPAHLVSLPSSQPSPSHLRPESNEGLPTPASPLNFPPVTDDPSDGASPIGTDEEASTVQTHLRQLQSEDRCCVFVARRINRMGLDSAQLLAAHYASYGTVLRVLVPQRGRVKAKSSTSSKQQMRIQPCNLGFVVMSSAESVDRILAEGPEQTVAGLEIGVQLFKGASLGQDSDAPASFSRPGTNASRE